MVKKAAGQKWNAARKKQVTEGPCLDSGIKASRLLFNLSGQQSQWKGASTSPSKEVHTGAKKEQMTKMLGLWAVRLLQQ